MAHSAQARPALSSLSGFPEWLPAGRVVEQHFIDTLRRTFELHGFSGVETRAVEPLGELTKKGETSKEVYLLSRLQAEHSTLPLQALPDPEGLARRAPTGGPLPRVLPGGHRRRRRWRASAAS